MAFNPDLMECPVCGKHYMTYITTKPTIRTKRDLPLYACLWCQSFSNPSGYTEDDEQMRKALDWHQKVAERNVNASHTLLQNLKEMGVPFDRILEIGAGTGTLLKVAKDYGSTGVGFEVNPLTQPYARDVNGVDVRAEFWDKTVDVGFFDLLVCIMVMEHIPQPRPMLKDMVEACIENDASLFISVPFVNRNRWHFLHDPNPKSKGSPFFDQDVHVTHYSAIGMELVLKEFGMTKISWIRKGLWHGVLARP